MKKNKNNADVNDKKISEKMKNKDWLSIEKDIVKCKTNHK